MGELISLADQINNEHRMGELAARDAIEHAIKAGELLIQAKAQVKHGEWLPWVRKTLTVTPRQAQKYIRVANHKEKLANTSESSHLSINEALAVLATPATGNEDLSIMQHLDLAAKSIDEIESFDSSKMFNFIDDMDLSFEVKLSIFYSAAKGMGGGPVDEGFHKNMDLLRESKAYLRYYLGKHFLEDSSLNISLKEFADITYNSGKLKDTYKTKQEWREMVFRCVNSSRDDAPKSLPDNPVEIVRDLISKHVDAVKRSIDSASVADMGVA